METRRKGCFRGAAEASGFGCLLVVLALGGAAAGLSLGRLLGTSPGVTEVTSMVGAVAGLALCFAALHRVTSRKPAPRQMTDLERFEAECMPLWVGENTPTVRFSYEFAGGGIGRQEVVPFRILRHPMRGLYVYGWSTRANDWRTFKVSQMGELEVDGFGEMSVSDWLYRGFGIAPTSN